MVALLLAAFIFSIPAVLIEPPNKSKYREKATKQLTGTKFHGENWNLFGNQFALMAIGLLSKEDVSSALRSRVKLAAPCSGTLTYI